MSHEDQKLDELLRSVEVPSDLHARLRAQLLEQASTVCNNRLQLESQISDAVQLQPKEKPSKQSQNRLQPQTWWIVATAASILLVVGGAVLWKMNLSPAGNTDSQIAATPNPAVDPSINQKASPTQEAPDRSAIEELDRQITAQKMLLLELERQEMEQRIEVAKHELVKLQAKPQLSDSSLTLAVVAETALKAGASPQVIREDLEFVIDRFPNSAGANMAGQILASLN
jgi:hypothetical protein